MSGSTLRLRFSLPLLIALAVLLAAAPRAAADPLPDGCTIILGGPYPAGPEVDVDDDGDPEATMPNPGASVCMEVDSGLPDSPATLTCYGVQECVLRVTVGHTGGAEAGAELCIESWPQVAPLCAGAETGTIPVVPIAPEMVCVGWSLQTSSCRVQYEDDR